MLRNKKILIGVTGSIAAYKMAILTRQLVKNGAEVRIILTPDAASFVTPLTLSTLSKNPVLTDYFDKTTGQWNSHVELGLWADVFLIAPATANTIGKMANGICDNLLMATYFSARSKVVVAPAMDLDMYQHPAVVKNIQKVQEFGNYIIPAEEGELASGLVGEGRMAEPEHIFNYLTAHFSNAKKLAGKKVLVNAGPTYEMIDPVRYIGNFSSGKMGVAIAEVLCDYGAEVHLVLGPNSVKPANKNILVYEVMSALNMQEECSALFPKMDAAILAAAVADFQPEHKSDIKIKKQQDSLTLNLVKTPDTLATLSAIKKKGQVLAGFALETNNELENAKQKLISKKLDFIVLNSLTDRDAGFGKDTNKITIIDPNGHIQAFEAKPKKEVAVDIIEHLIGKL